MEHTAHIVIVEDEPDLAALLADYLAAASYSTTVIKNGDEAWQWLTQNQPDLILLDLMLPGKNGLDICRGLRQDSSHPCHAVPIIIMTAKVEEVDRLIGLELGADDYICKPYSPREVVARVRAVLRRMFTEDKPVATEAVLLDEHANKVTVNGQVVELTVVEFKLLQLLFNAPGRIFSRQAIMDAIYSDYRVVSDRTVDSHIKKLRKKLQQVSPEQELVRSVYGAGYKFESGA